MVVYYLRFFLLFTQFNYTDNQNNTLKNEENPNSKSAA